MKIESAYCSSFMFSRSLPKQSFYDRFLSSFTKHPSQKLIALTQVDEDPGDGLKELFDMQHLWNDLYGMLETIRA